MSAHNAVYEHLHGIQIQDLVKTQDLVVVKEDLDLNATVHKMNDKHIVSIPVVSAGDENECIGYVDSLDIVAHLVAAAPQEHSEIEDATEKRIEQLGRVIRMQTVGHIQNFSGRDPYVPVNMHSNVSMALDFFCKGIHRLPIVDDAGAIVATLSQSEVNRYLVGETEDATNHLERGALGTFAAQTLEQLNLHQVDGLISVTEDDDMFDAVHAMSEAGVSAVAVTNDGKLSADLSATAVRGVYDEKLPNLLKSVKDFLDEHSPDSEAPAVARADSTLLEVCVAIAKGHIHRVWVVDDDYKPVGVVSLTDIMAVFHAATL